MAFFERTADGFDPLPHAASQWSTQTINGAAVAGLAAYAVETEHGESGLVPARFTIDLFRQPLFRTLTVRTLRIRDGRTLRVADVWVEQDDKPVARATLVSARPTAQPLGARWTPQPLPKYPRTEEFPPLAEPGGYWGSDAHPSGWSRSMADHQNASRKRLWIHQTDVLADEPSSPFVRAASVGELTNTLASWGDRGIGFINHDFTMLLSRNPIGAEIGIEADNHTSDHGMAAGAATLYDREGRFGLCVVSAVAHAMAGLDLSEFIENEHWSGTRDGTAASDITETR
ncbi:acyl-CoA thioesterase domain-containing protein [Nocardia heshunensis]